MEHKETFKGKDASKHAIKYLEGLGLCDVEVVITHHEPREEKGRSIGPPPKKTSAFAEGY